MAVQPFMEQIRIKKKKTEGFFSKIVKNGLSTKNIVGYIYLDDI